MPARFTQWFRSTAATLDPVMRYNCSSELQAFQNSPSANFSISQFLCRGVYDCILEHSSPTTSSIFQAANVLLGLTPTALSFLGNSTAEISLLSSRRPLLSFLLALGAPTIAPFATFKYSNPMEELRVRNDKAKYPNLHSSTQRIISIVEYLFAIASAINVTLLAYDLAFKSVFIPSCIATFHPFLWLYTTGLVHLGGIWTFASRVKTERVRRENKRFEGWWKDEIRLCAAHRDVVYTLQPETYLYLFLAWLVSTTTVFHLVYGTLVLSSSTLINVNDAVFIIFRYIVSTVVCRMVLMFEVYGIRAAVVNHCIDQGHVMGRVELGS